MADTNKNDRIDQSRRKLLQYALPSLMAGIVAPSLLQLRCAEAADAAPQSKNVLVVYYSRTGNTRTMANYIHSMSGSDIVEIQTVNPYPAEYRATTRQAKDELESGYKPPLATKVTNMASYNVVFVGSPCWWGTIAPPVISLLSQYDLSGTTVVPFMTHKGSGLGRTMSHVRELCGKANVLQGLALWGDDIGSSRDKVAGWLRSIGMA